MASVLLRSSKHQVTHLLGLPCRIGQMYLPITGYATSSNHMSLIKKLRDQSGAPISDVKKALEETDWDVEKASQELRKKGLSAASKKASRSATEGLVGLSSNTHAAAIVEINSETDFVARNDLFTSVVSGAAQALLAQTKVCGKDIDVETLGNLPMEGTENNTILGAVQEVAGNVRENIKLRRGVVIRGSLDGTEPTVGTYLHGRVGPGVGRIAAAVLLESADGDSLDANQSKILQDTAHNLAMHVVASSPKYLSRNCVPRGDLDKERSVLVEQARSSGKPENIIEKMVQGRLNKFYQDVCLLEQPFVMEEKKSVADVVNGLSKTLQRDVTLTEYVRIQVGEGLEEQESKKDFAAEVSETIASTK